MHIFLDNIIFSLQREGGISVYWSELIKRIIIEPNSTTFFFETKNAANNLFRKILSINESQIIKKYSNISLISERYRSININSNEKSIFHSSYYRIAHSKNKNIQQIVTVHDFTYEYFRKGLAKHVHLWQKYKAIEKAKAIICVSENTKKDLLTLYPKFNKKRIEVIHNGVSEDFFPIKKDITENFLLYVGSRTHYKNFWFAVQTVANLSNYKLYIVSSPLNSIELAKLDKLIPNRYLIFSSIPNEQLNILYNHATALLYPSSYEGFGIPLVEAMKAGCPVIALASSSIPEVCGLSGILLEKLKINDCIDAIKEVENNRGHFSKIGIERANQFSWSNCFNQTLSIYKDLISN